MTDEKTTETETELPPPYNAEAVGRVASRVQIENIELLGLVFQRRDDAPLGRYHGNATPDELGVGVEWDSSETGVEFGCAITFAARFESEEAPYELVARFGLAYSIREGEPLTSEDLLQFAHWNAVFNAWPYWREVAANTIARTSFEPLVVPVMGVPREVPTPDST